MTWMFHSEVLVIGVAAICLLFTLFFSLVKGVQYSIAFAKLPAATRWRELEVEVGALEAKRDELDVEVRDLKSVLGELGKAESEIEFWRTQVELTKAEYANLADQRREIEETREAFRNVLEELTLAETQLRSLKADAEAAGIEANASKKAVEAAAEQLKEIEARGEELAQAHEALETEIMTREQQISALKVEREAAAVDLERSKDRLRSLEKDCASAIEEKSRLSADIDKSRAALEEVGAEMVRLPARREEIEKIRKELADLVKRKDVADAAFVARQEEIERIIDEKERREALLLARIARLEKELPESTGGVGDDNESSLADLVNPPACLAVKSPQGNFHPSLPSQLAAEAELDALERVAKHLEDSGFEFPRRTLNAFHTSLKTAVISPLTVLAGISGTGKSQLPRYYADAMGVHFLKIPVQPRWDGPQDLFGFYNYIEKRYKATDLARALVHLDPCNWREHAKPYEDRMLIVLLDEMNLARVEYYFSEFLSRLEGRPFNDLQLSQSDRRSAEIDIDISRSGQAKRVYAGQNVLFVGTMNEDESTLTLSDKVLDRANILRFPKPLKLKEELPVSADKSVAKGYLPKQRWMESWMRKADDLHSSQVTRATDVIRKINEIMNELGRPFGHRMGQAMLHYVANYPAPRNATNNVDQVNFGLADQIEQRIMPKLRGVPVDAYRRAISDLAKLASDELEDKELSEEIMRTLDRGRANDMFVWRGFTRDI